MKTILKIIIILLVGAVIAGVFSFAVNNSSTASSSNDGGQPPAMISSDGQELMARSEGGDQDSGSITQGLSGVIGTLAKLTGISILVLLLQKGSSLLEKRRSILNPR